MSKPIAVIITGSQNFNDYEMLKRRCDRILSKVRVAHILCGMEPGTDTLGKKYAEERKWPVRRMPVDWETHGRAAGPIRNEQMARAADALIAFWDGDESSDTQNMINLAHQHELMVRVIRI